jgi:hypothetical protein
MQTESGTLRLARVFREAIPTENGYTSRLRDGETDKDFFTRV